MNSFAAVPVHSIARGLVPDSGIWGSLGWGKAGDRGGQLKRKQVPLACEEPAGIMAFLDLQKLSALLGENPAKTSRQGDACIPYVKTNGTILGRCTTHFSLF